MNKENKFTPGPWQVHIHRYPNGKLSHNPYVYAPNGKDQHRHICQPFIDDETPEIKQEQEANARLIAAAPELLEACDKVQRAWTGDGIDMSTSVDACLLAIAKALGNPQ